MRGKGWTEMNRCEVNRSELLVSNLGSWFRGNGAWDGMARKE